MSPLDYETQGTSTAVPKTFKTIHLFFLWYQVAERDTSFMACNNYTVPRASCRYGNRQYDFQYYTVRNATL